MVWKIVGAVSVCLIAIALYFSVSSPTTISSTSKVRIAISTDITTFDPRQARDLTSSNLLHLLFTGLTRLSADGKIYPELAESIESSDDGTTYHITLRNAFWSDGSPITPDDFIYSWTSMLNKSAAFPNAHFLFWVRNAKDIYNGQSTKSLGIHAKGERSLEIELEQPCPFFKELLATLPYCAIQKKYVLEGGSFTKDNPSPSSGPYTFHKWLPQTTIQFTKNTRYFAAEKVMYDYLDFPIMEESTAVSMIEQHSLDWVGSPLGFLPIDAIPYLRETKQLSVCPSFGTTFIRVNATRPHINDATIRKALSLSIDREELVAHVLQGGQEPAYTLVPPCMLQQVSSVAHCHDDPKSILKTYCDENKISPTSIHLSLAFAAGERNLKIAQVLQQEFKRKLSIEVDLHPCEPKLFFSKIVHLDYDLALGSWFPDYPDPHSFYSVFENATNGTNNTGWESSIYQSLLSTSSEVLDLEKRTQLFIKMEQLLARDLPVIPLFHASFTYVKEASVDGLRVSSFGFIDPIQS